MNAKLALLLSVFFLASACNAYRTTPDSEILFTKKDLVKKGFVIAPITDVSAKSFSSVGDLNAYDSILANTLTSQWPKADLVSTALVTRSLDGEQTELWREELIQEDLVKPSLTSSPASIKIMQKLKALGVAAPNQVLLASLLQNTVSCGHKEGRATYLAPEPRGPKAYCQRIMKMRFRVLNLQKTDFVWNGIIYATQESTQPTAVSVTEEDKPLDPPSTQALIRDCFTNFARQFSEK